MNEPTVLPEYDLDDLADQVAFDLRQATTAYGTDCTIDVTGAAVRPHLVGFLTAILTQEITT